MSCTRYEDELTEHALGGDAGPALSTHLSSCAACRQRLDDERASAAEMDATLADALRLEPGPQFEAGIRRRVRTARVRRTTAWVAVAAGLAAALAAIAVLMRPTPRSTPVDVAAGTPLHATEAPTAAPPSPPAPPAPVASTRTVEPEVLVAPEDGLALDRFAARLRQPRSDATWDPQARVERVDRAAHEFDPLAVGTLEELPRLHVSDVPRYDASPWTSPRSGPSQESAAGFTPAEREPGLATGGGV
jgi:hypothetical protein